MNYQQVSPALADEKIFRQTVIAKIGTILQTIKAKNYVTIKNDNCGQASQALRERESIS